MNRSTGGIHEILSTFRPPDRAIYPELDGYSRDKIHREFFSI